MISSLASHVKCAMQVHYPRHERQYMRSAQRLRNSPWALTEKSDLREYFNSLTREAMARKRSRDRDFWSICVSSTRNRGPVGMCKSTICGHLPSLVGGLLAVVIMLGSLATRAQESHQHQVGPCELAPAPYHRPTDYESVVPSLRRRHVGHWVSPTSRA